MRFIFGSNDENVLECLRFYYVDIFSSKCIVYFGIEDKRIVIVEF